MLREWSVAEQRYRAVLEVLDGATVTLVAQVETVLSQQGGEVPEPAAASCCWACRRYGWAWTVPLASPITDHG
jgi:hypothetical protein